jgi:hypothetical protein
MSTMKTTETELRHAVIDRLIAASMRDGTPAREATLERWRTLATDQPSIPQPSKNYTGL